MPKLKDGGKPVRSGKWQIMINGESYKWIVAEAAKKALGMDRIQERIFIVKLVNDKNDPKPHRRCCWFLHSRPQSRLCTSPRPSCWLPVVA